MGIILFFIGFCFGQSPEWSQQAFIPDGGRWNPYGFSQDVFSAKRARGQMHAHLYPVQTTGILIPEEPLREILDNTTWNPLVAILNEIFKDVTDVDSFDGLFRWAGLVPPPSANSPSQFLVALPDSYKSGDLYGFSRFKKNGVDVFTMSCAACHSDQLFGQTVLGMSKRFPRANDFFIRAQRAAPLYSSWLVQLYTGATNTEMEFFDRAFENLNAVGLRQPIALGLDTSLAQVALSLNKRAPTPWADKDSFYENDPRPDDLDRYPGDSKPAVWWNTKYKTRWLSDGSVIDGNPIYTNLLWNELGRGSDLHELDAWFAKNPNVIEELTTMVFSSEAPRFEDFFPAAKIDRASAMNGEKIFLRTCTRCHGIYEKNWSQPNAEILTWSEQMKTRRVVYPQPTRVYDVGTDPYRRKAMKSLERLNELQISKNKGILVKAQEGYVPPPLVGIWARWPYLHNNSIPNLCALLTRADQRPKTYVAGAPKNKNRDFDSQCNGYPLGAKAPSDWFADPDYFFDTQITGLSNSGHDEGIFLRDGQELLSAPDKNDLIQFLQTL
jgi:cytochrome c5